VKIIDCPDCGSEVVECDNNVYLDYPSVSYDEVKAPWTIMRFSSMGIASVGDPSLDGKGHSLHGHQPTGGVMA